jgi:hypothetical protein
VSDVTAEEVERERTAAHELATKLYVCSRFEACTEKCDRIATALAVRAREARREALKEALTNEQAAADSLRDWMNKQPIHSEKRKELSLRSGERYQSADSIRALLGPET